MANDVAPSSLFPVVYAFLGQNGFKKTQKKFKAEALLDESGRLKDDKNPLVTATLADLYRAFLAQNTKPAETKPGTAQGGKVADDKSGSSEKSGKQGKKKGKKRKAAEKSEDSQTGKQKKKQKVEPKKEPQEGKTQKSDGMDISKSEDKKPAKATKKEKKEAKDEKKEAKKEEKEEKTEEKKEEKKESLPEQAKEETTSDKKKAKKAKKLKNSKSEATSENGADASEAAQEGDSAAETSQNSEGKKEKKEKGVNRFQRIDSSKIKVADRLADNSYYAKGGESWGAKAQQDFGVVKGDRFRHEKTKKKRGSYRGGPISMAVLSVPIGSDDES